MTERIICEYTQQQNGALLIIFGAMHGNEPAGVVALEQLQEMLYQEKEKNPAFQFYGKIIGIKGNSRAFALNQRFIVKDLNRQWQDENIERILKSDEDHLTSEELEIKEILSLIQSILKAFSPTKIVILDIHTTSAEGGIFAIPSHEENSVELGKAMHVPVVKKLLDGLNGTTLHYFCSKNMGGIPTTALCFEAGQHQSPTAVSRAIAAIVNCMRSIGMVDEHDVESKHDELLKASTKGFPAVSELFYIHKINHTDNFSMNPGYLNFNRIQAGELLAKDKNGAIHAPKDSLILMPLYQKQGEEGFFLIEEVD